MHIPVATFKEMSLLDYGTAKCVKFVEMADIVGESYQIIRSILCKI